jgi:type IV secretion system protein VirB5
MKIRTLTVVVAMAISSHANAALPVIDAAALAQASQQVKAWGEQYQQMRTQIEALNFQIKSMTGDRGMATLLPMSKAALPADWAQSMSNLSTLAQQIRQSQAVLRPDQVAQLSPELQRLLSQAQDISASHQAMAQLAFNDAAVRQARLQVLTNTLGTTTDPKAAFDLANRIAIEHAELIRDQNQLEAAANGAAAQERAERLMVNQMRASSFGTRIPKIDTSLP